MRNYLIACVIGAILSCIGTWRLCYVHYQVKQLQIDNRQLQINNDRLVYNSKVVNAQIEATESAIKAITFERDVITGEYGYANKVIQKYQAQLNARTHIDSSFVRMAKATERATAMPDLATITAGSSTTDGELTASGGLSYISQLRESLEICIVRSRLKDMWYDALRSNYNAN